MPRLASISVPDARDAYVASGIDSWSDRRLAAEAADRAASAARGMGPGPARRPAAEAAEVVAVPTGAPAASFVLHAPLGLLARVGLLRAVRPDAREQARQRIVWLAATYAAAGPP